MGGRGKETFGLLLVNNFCGFNRERAGLFYTLFLVCGSRRSMEVRKVLLLSWLAVTCVCVFLPESRWQFHFAKFSYTVSWKRLYNALSNKCNNKKVVSGCLGFVRYHPVLPHHQSITAPRLVAARICHSSSSSAAPQHRWVSSDFRRLLFLVRSSFFCFVCFWIITHNARSVARTLGSRNCWIFVSTRRTDQKNRR